MLCYSMQSLVLIFFVGIYPMYLSFAAFVLSVIIVTAAGTIFHYRSCRLTAERAAAAEQERRLFDRLADFLDGFKEIRLNTARSSDLFEDAVGVSRTAASIKIHTQTETFRQVVSAQSSMYILLGAVVFVAPHFSDLLGSGSITKTMTALLFVVGACFGLVQSIPILMNSNAAADRMSQLEAALQATAMSGDVDEFRAPKQFDHIEMRNIMFRYVGQIFRYRFQDWADRLQFAIRRPCLHHRGQWFGQIDVFESAGGSLSPDLGEITLDGISITDDTRDMYRGLMSAIFFDYHLFRRLYGIPEPEPGELHRLLTLFRLSDKTALTNGEFRTLDLSGGQRRRLALIVSLLENVQLSCWTSGQQSKIPNFGANSMTNFYPR